MKSVYAKKFLASFMAVLVLLSSLSICLVSAETQGDFEYELYTSYDEDWNATNYIEITDYKGNASEVTIPAEIAGLPVTSIGYGAFMDCSTLTSVTVPDSVTYIGDWAFDSCVNLETVNLPDTLTYIGSSILSDTAFIKNGANWDNHLLYIDKYLICVDNDVENAVEIKEGTELIASLTFCFTDITSVKLPESLKCIGEAAFAECESLTDITLPSKLEKICGYAFEYCTALTEVYIPASVTTLGYNVFTDCTNLKSLTLAEGIETIPAGFVSNCKSLKSFTIPSTVKEIEYYAIENSGIETINIPAGVESIYSEAFAGCENLTSITVDSENVYYYAIDGVLYKKSPYGFGDYLYTYPAGKADTTYTLPENANGIESFAFAGVKNLKKVSLHGNTYNGRFFYAYSLEEVDVAEANEYLYDIDGVVFEKETNNLIYYPSGKQGDKYTVPAGTTEINSYAFDLNDNLTEITVSEGVESMEFGAISMCDNLKVINLPSTLTYIDSYAIDSCDNLTTINYNGTKAQWDAFEAEPYTDSTEGLYLNCTDGTFELVAPYTPEEDPTEGDTYITSPEPDDFTEPTGTSSTNPTESTPEGSTATDPTETTTSDDKGTTVPENEFELGDANMDKKLNIRDATAIQKYLAKIITFDETALELADFTQDGKVNIKDATTIQKKLAGLI